MHRFRAYHLSLIIFIMLLALYPCSATAITKYSLGDKVQDFTFVTFDGEETTLSDVLQTKDAVLINIWATWCGPCRSEFPHMQKAYEKYQDRIEIFALSCEPSDTAATLSAFAENYGLTFKMGQDPVDFLYALGTNSIPTSIMIDRFGKICFIQSGALPDEASFTRLFDTFIGDQYTESVLLDSIPPQKPNVIPFDESELAQALNIDGSTIAFHNPTDGATWPMLVTEVDDRLVVKSSNANIESSEASIYATVSAKQGDALVITFKLSCEPVFDTMQLQINQMTVKSFAGAEAWQTYAYEFPADGEYQVSVSYTKNQSGSAGMDTLWLDSIALLSGSEAEKAFAQNPVYPTSKEIAISVLNEQARMVRIEDPTGSIAARYGDSVFYLIPDDQAVFSFNMVEDYDPETAIVYFNYDNSMMALSDCLNQGTYQASSGGDSISTTGYCDSSVILYPDQYTAGTVLTYFKSEKDIEVFLSALTQNADGKTLGVWSYVEQPPMIDTDPEATISKVRYILRCIDQYGEPVFGVMLQVCDELTCQVLRTDETGYASFTAAPYAWEIHVLISPDGYTAQSTETLTAQTAGGEMVFHFNKN